MNNEFVSALGQCVYKEVRKYLLSLQNNKVSGLYALVLKEIEKPLLQAVMEKANWNQTKAAKCLGISRGTLQRKLKSIFEA